MTFDKGSLILVDYTAKVKDDDEVFDTTLEADAKKYSLHEENAKYHPKLVSIGETSYPVLKGFDEALAKTSVGDKLTIEVTPDKGFGARDSTKVRMIPLRKLGEDAEKVSVGDTIEVDNKRGIIRFIGSGRVQIDYNHRYAGKTILYDVNVLKALDTPNDKVDAILKERLPVEDSKIAFDLKDKEASIPIPEDILKQMVDAGIRAPSGSNRQGWKFIVVTDQKIKNQLGDSYREAWDFYVKEVYGGSSDLGASNI